VSEMKVAELTSPVISIKKPSFDIAAFQVPKHHSILYKSFLNEEKLLEAVKEAITKGANVISIRKVEEL
jgi:hypothetical protein